MNTLTTASNFSHPYAQNFANTLKTNGADLLPYEVIAINRLVNDLVTYNLWSKIHALYPFVGRTAASHSINLINPLIYPITWSGTITHDGFGITGDGSTSSGDTRLNPSLVSAFTNNLSFGIYCRTSNTNTTKDIEAFQSGTVTAGIHVRYTDNNTYWDNVYSTARVAINVGSSLGLFVCSRTASNFMAAYRNGAIVGSTNNGQGTIPNASFKLLSGNTVSNRNYSLAFIGIGLTPGDNVFLYRTVQNFQALLGRSV